MVYYVSVRQCVFKHLFFNSSTEIGPNPNLEKQSLSESNGTESLECSSTGHTIGNLQSDPPCWDPSLKEKYLLVPWNSF